jgi:hypothetical protein
MRTLRLSALIIAVAVAALFVGVQYGKQRASYTKVVDPREDTWVTLSRQADGRCVPSDPLQLRIQRGKNVVWHVTNGNCDGSYVVSFRNFGKKESNGAVTPTNSVIDPHPTSIQNAISPGQSSVAIARVSAAIPVGEYKYEIWIGVNGANPTMGRDPDIDIWP